MAHISLHHDVEDGYESNSAIWCDRPNTLHYKPVEFNEKGSNEDAGTQSEVLGLS